MIEYFVFYQNQIWIGVTMGLLMSALGVFVVLRKMVFFGITLSQASALSYTILMILEANKQPSLFFLTAVFIFPFYFFAKKTTDGFSGSEVFLASGFVAFTALGNLLLSVGGNVQNHLISAFFGDILMIDPQQWSGMIPLLVSSVVVFFILYKPLISMIVDVDSAKLSGIPVFLVDGAFFFLLTFLAGATMQYMGTYYTIAQMVLPAVFGLFLARSIPGTILLAMGFSLVTGLAGFFLSFVEIHADGGSFHLPTTSTIILVMTPVALLPAFIRFACVSLRKSGFVHC